MTYLIVQTFILLLVAGLLGLIFGWYLTRSSASAARAALQTRLRKAEMDTRELRNEMKALATAKANCDTERRLLSDELADLRARQGQRTGTEDAGELATMQDELEKCRKALAAGPMETGGGEVDGPVAGAAAQVPATGTAPLLMSDADGEADDLQLIKGVGPKIAGILAELGIRRFEQIAAWTPENVAWVNAHLKFKGRVEREQWIPQAKALLADRET